MRYTGKYKRTLGPTFVPRYNNQSIYVGIPITKEKTSILRSAGFENFEHGATVLPAKFGKVTEFNAYGEEIVQKDLPKETVYYTVSWEREEWRGRDNTERVTSYIERSYKKYPRKLIPPPSKEISLYKNDGKD